MPDFLITDMDDDLMAALEAMAATEGATVEDVARRLLVEDCAAEISSPSRGDGEGDRFGNKV